MTTLNEAERAVVLAAYRYCNSEDNSEDGERYEELKAAVEGWEQSYKTDRPAIIPAPATPIPSPIPLIPTVDPYRPYYGPTYTPDIPNHPNTMRGPWGDYGHVKTYTGPAKISNRSDAQ